MAARVLVVFASKHGSTKGLAHVVGATLHSCGHEVRVLPAVVVRSVTEYDAVVVGSAIYHDYWLWDGHRFLRRMRGQLRGRATWLFSSGPTGGTPAGDVQVATLCGADTAVPDTLVGSLRGLDIVGHATFAGKLGAHAVTSREAWTPLGDWRDICQVRAWARQVGDRLPTAVSSREPTRAGRM